MKLFLRNKYKITTLAVLGVFVLGAFYLVFYLLSIKGTIGGLSLLGSETVKEHIIELHEDGFYPKEFVINKGDTVVFKTTLGKPFWPASNLHPSHTIYSEFDSREPINPEDIWNFRFDKLGKWEYHDHLSPNYTGEIIALNKEWVTESVISECLSSNLNRKEACWDEQPELILETRGLDAAFDFLLESFLATGNTKDTSEFCGYVSSEVSINDPFVRCIHRIGRGVTAGMAEDPKIWGDYQAMIDIGTQRCEEALSIPRELWVCWEGVFNMVSQSINANEFGLSLDFIEKDFFHICREQEEKYKSACYLEFAGIIQALTGHDFNKAARMVIEEILYPRMAAHTIKKISLDFMREDIASPDNDKNVLDCRGLPEVFHAECFKGVVTGFVWYGEQNVEYVKGLEFCATRILTEEERKICYNTTLGRFVDMYPEEKMKEICETVDTKYKNRCD